MEFASFTSVPSTADMYAESARRSVPASTPKASSICESVSPRAPASVIASAASTLTGDTRLSPPSYTSPNSFAVNSDAGSAASDTSPVGAASTPSSSPAASEPQPGSASSSASANNKASFFLISAPPLCY